MESGIFWNYGFISPNKIWLTSILKYISISNWIFLSPFKMHFILSTQKGELKNPKQQKPQKETFMILTYPHPDDIDFYS